MLAHFYLHVNNFHEVNRGGLVVFKSMVHRCYRILKAFVKENSTKSKSKHFWNIGAHSWYYWNASSLSLIEAYFLDLRASPPVLSMWPRTLKLAEDESTYLWLRKMVFLLRICSVCWGWWKPQQSCAPVREECNKYNWLLIPGFWLANHNEWSRWFAVST